MSSDHRLAQLVIPEIHGWTGNMLDVACGFGFWAQVFRRYSQVNCVVGVDIWKPYLLEVKRLYDDVVLASALQLPFRDKSFENVVACEVIEHLLRRNVSEFLVGLDRISQKHILVSTPNYRYVQGPLRGNPYEEHVSLWNYKDFRKLGFDVKGVGLRFIGRFAFSMLPPFGRFFRQLFPSGRMVRFSELIIGFK